MAQKRTIARPYASALFEVAAREQALSTWSEWLDFLARAAKHEAIERMLADPALAGDVKAHHLLELLESHSDAAASNAALRNFVRLLGMNKRLDLFVEVASEFERLKRQAEKRRQVLVATAYPLAPEQRERLARKLAQRLGGEVEIHEQTDASLIGGAVIRYGDQVIDGSLRGRVSKLSESLRKRAA